MMKKLIYEEYLTTESVLIFFTKNVVNIKFFFTFVIWCVSLKKIQVRTLFQKFIQSENVSRCCFYASDSFFQHGLFCGN